MKAPNKTNIHLILPVIVTAMLFAGLGTATAQQTLRALAEEGGVTWLIGKWTGSSQDGTEVTVEYEWELDGHAVEIDLQMGRGAYKGLAFLSPEGGEEAVEVGGDNRGGMTRAVWREDYGRLISERVSTRPDGEIMRVAVISEQTGAKTMKATVHSLSANGVIDWTPMDTVKLTRVESEEEDDD